MPQRNDSHQQKIDAHQQINEKSVTSNEMEQGVKVWPVTPTRGNKSESNSGTVSSSTDCVTRCAETSSESLKHQRDTKTGRPTQKHNNYQRSTSVHSDNGSATSRGSNNNRNSATHRRQSLTNKQNGENVRFRQRDNRRYSLSNARHRQDDGWQAGQARHYNAHRNNNQMNQWGHREGPNHRQRGPQIGHQEWHGSTRRAASNGSYSTVQHRAAVKTGAPVWHQRERINGVADYEPCEKGMNNFVQDLGYPRWSSGIDGVERRYNRNTIARKSEELKYRSRYDQHQVNSSRSQVRQSNAPSVAALRPDENTMYLNQINRCMDNISIDNNKRASSYVNIQRNNQNNGDRLESAFSNTTTTISHDINRDRSLDCKNIDPKNRKNLSNTNVCRTLPGLDINRLLKSNVIIESQGKGYTVAYHEPSLIKVNKTEPSIKTNLADRPLKETLSNNECHDELEYDVAQEMAMASKYNIPLRWSDLNPAANEFRPVCSNESKKSDTHSQFVVNVKPLESNCPSETLTDTNADVLNNKTHETIIQPSLSREAEHFNPLSWQENTNTNGVLQTSSQITSANSTVAFLPASGTARTEARQTFSLQNATYTQPQQVLGYQNMPLFCSPNYNDLVNASVPYVHSASPQELPQSVVPASCVPGQYCGTETSYPAAEHPGHNQDLTPIVLGAAPGTPMPLIATPITPVGIYNDGHFTYRVASVPTPTMVTCPDVNLRTTHTEPRLFAPSQQSAYYQPSPPVMNFQSYCMAVDSDNSLMYQPQTQKIEELGSVYDVSNNIPKIPSLIDRIGDTLKEVQQSLKTSKVRRNKTTNHETNTWGEILEKIMKLPPNFQEPNELEEYRHLKKLSEIISNYIDDVRSESNENLSESAIFQEVLDLSWPVANMDLSKGSDMMPNVLNVMKQDDSANKSNRNRIDRINKSRMCLQKAWYELAMSISKQSSPETNLRNAPMKSVITDELPQCDQVTLSKLSQGNDHFKRMGSFDEQIQQRVVQGDNVYTQMFGQDLSRSGPDADNGQNRRQSLGNVNIGTRISYWESNTKQDESYKRQYRAKK